MEIFLKKKGATKCPGSFTPELRAHHIKQRELYEAMTPEDRYKAGLSAHRGGGRYKKYKTLSIEDRKERNRKYQRDRYAKKKIEPQ